MKYISGEEHLILSKRCNPQSDDILLTKIGTIGLAAVIPKNSPTFDLFVSVCLIKPKKEIVNIHFLSAVINSPVARLQFARDLKGVGVPDLHLENIAETLIPLPPIEIQRSLVAELEAARQTRKQKLTQADELLSSLDAYLLDQLGLAPAAENEQSVFGVYLSILRGKRLDAMAYKPFYAKGLPPETPTNPLWQIADINKHSILKPESDEDLVPYVGLPECSLTEVREVVMRPYREVKGRNIIRQGDILFARIEPSVFNKKYVLVDDLKGYKYTYTSTEFYVVSAKKVLIDRDYLYAMFFCTFVFNQVKGKTTGSSGRRRIDTVLFSELQIPIPSSDIQANIAKQIKFRREQARQLRQEAESEWQAAKTLFEQKLLGEEA